MKKEIVELIDWHNSVCYVVYSDGSKGITQSRNVPEELRKAYRDDSSNLPRC